MMKTYYIECDCQSIEHLVRIGYIEEDDCIFVDTQLNHYLPWWKRIQIGFFYMIGQQTGKFTHYENAIIDKKRLAELFKIFNAIKKEMKNV